MIALSHNLVWFKSDSMFKYCWELVRNDITLCEWKYMFLGSKFLSNCDIFIIWRPAHFQLFLIMQMLQVVKSEGE